jgi:hypothetical protein
MHGMVLLGLEQKLIAVPIEVLREDRDHRAGDGRGAYPSNSISDFDGAP